MTIRQTQLRHYYFRELVAHADFEHCAKGQGPFILTWRDARLMWQAATIVANAQTTRAKRVRCK
jgi:hypothetical protein